MPLSFHITNAFMGATMKKYLALSACAASMFLTGCASVTNEAHQTLRVQALDETGREIERAECVLNNGYAPVNIAGGHYARVQRSSADLDIVCKAPNQVDAKGRAISRLNGGFAGNILLGGPLGMAVDAANGKAYSYPTWLQLVFGQSAVYDRAHERDGKPTPATQVSHTAQAPTPNTAPASSPAAEAVAAPVASAPKALAATGTAPQSDTAEKLKKLDELYEKGLISQEEWTEKRAKVLDAL